MLQTYLPDALGAMQELTAWATARRAAGGAPIKVRVVKGANLAMEHVDAAIHGWPLATYDTKQDSDTNYKRVLHWSMTPERTDAVKLGVAGHNLFDVAHAWLTARERGVDVARRVRDAPRHGDRPGRGRAPRRRQPAALHARREPERVRRGDRLPHPPPRGEREPGQLHVGRVRARQRRRASSSASRTATCARSRRSRRTAARTPAPNRTQNRRTEWTDASLAAAMAVPDAPAPGTEHEDDASLTSTVLEHHARLPRATARRVRRPRLRASTDAAAAGRRRRPVGPRRHARLPQRARHRPRARREPRVGTPHPRPRARVAPRPRHDRGRPRRRRRDARDA